MYVALVKLLSSVFSFWVLYQIYALFYGNFFLFFGAKFKLLERMIIVLP
jgi:hypothetical protein